MLGFDMTVQFYKFASHEGVNLQNARTPDISKCSFMSILYKLWQYTIQSTRKKKFPTSDWSREAQQLTNIL